MFRKRKRNSNNCEYLEEEKNYIPPSSLQNYFNRRKVQINTNIAGQRLKKKKNFHLPFQNNFEVQILR